MTISLDLTEKRFGRLVAIRYEKSIDGKRHWLCRCDCGRTALVDASRLNRGIAQACGCQRKSLHLIKHGAARKGRPSREYSIWIGMKSRCCRPTCKEYKYYGARGISICKRWNISFKNFLADMGHCPPGYSIERINNDGDYKPSNCKWIPRGEQRKNRRDTLR